MELAELDGAEMPRPGVYFNHHQRHHLKIFLLELMDASSIRLFPDWDAEIFEDLKLSNECYK